MPVSKEKTRDSTYRAKKAAYAKEWRQRPGNKERMALASKKWRQANPARARLASKKHYLAKLYRLSPEQYEEMLRLQGRACAICKTTNETLHVDHDHKTGFVRGLLCGKCNRGLGLFQDKMPLLNNAITYLIQHENNRADP